MSAYHLTKSGLKVLMLEAGRNYDPVAETPMFNTNAEAPLRGASTPDKPFGFYDATVDGGWEVPNEPYTVAPGSEPFIWWRPRMLGGAHQPLGPHRAAVRRAGLQALQPRRPGPRLADLLRRPGALVRQDREADRRLRRRARAGPAEHPGLAPRLPDGIRAAAGLRDLLRARLPGHGHPRDPDARRRGHPDHGRPQHLRLRHPPAAAAARSAPTSSRPPSCCRRPWPRAT